MRSISISIAALVMGMLNAKNVFGVPAMASSFFNIGSIIGGLVLGYWIDPHFGPRALIGLAFATVIGGALQLAVQLPSLARLGYRFRPDLRWRDAECLQELWRADVFVRDVLVWPLFDATKARAIGRAVQLIDRQEEAQGRPERRAAASR